MKKALFPGALFLGLLPLFLFLLPPSGSLLNPEDLSRVYWDREGALLRVSLSEDDKYRMGSPLGDYPPTLTEALLLKEDQYFYAHGGVDFPAILRAAYESYVLKERLLGASTITMQLVRLREGLYTRSIPGKIRQIIGALYLDWHYTKEEILEAYLVLAPMGGNIEGFDTASYLYLGKSPIDLTLAEILYLVNLPQDPQDRAPVDGGIPEEGMAARKALFLQWIERHPQDKQWAFAMDLPLAIEEAPPFEIPHGIDYLERKPSRERPLSSTTFDLSLQKLLENHVEGYVQIKGPAGVKNGGALLLNFQTMEVLAAVGSVDYFDEAIQGQVIGFASRRSPGSTLKPFIYAMAMDQGVIHPQSLLKDTPAPFGTYTPDNYQSYFAGPVPAWDALVNSRNIPAINLARKLKQPDLYDFLKKAGVGDLKPREHYGLSLVLGSGELSLLEIAKLYALLPNGGLLQEVRFYRDSRESPQVPLLTRESAYLTLEMLRKNPQDHSGPPLPFKTGTSIGFKDCWTAGVFDTYVLVVWIGNFDGRGNPAFIGRDMAAPLFFQIAQSLLESHGTGYTSPPIPEGIREVEVCSVSGGIPHDYCPDRVVTGFIPGVSPITKCKVHREISIDTRTGYRSETQKGDFVTTEVREVWPTDLLKLFEQAGLPRLTPPPYPPENRGEGADQGFPPEIYSPLEGGEYIIDPSGRHKFIPLEGGMDGDSEVLYWFGNNLFLGKSTGRVSPQWEPRESGGYTITAVDSQGRSRSVEILVTLDNSP